jgi:predicted acyl esterase
LKDRKVYSGDSLNLTVRDYVPSPHVVSPGEAVEGVYFDGYPQIVKEPGSQPTYEVKKEKDLMVAVRDGVRLALDVYRPDVEGEKFPAILAWGFWGKDAQESVAWLHDKQQPYYDSPFWDGSLEAGNYLYTVPRGYAHVIPDPRGVGDSEGFDGVIEQAHNPDDIYDVVEWIAAQPW